MAAAARRKFIDIGANLSDPVFRGVYRGKQKHQDDFMNVLRRASDIGMTHIVVTGGSLHESEVAINLCREYAVQKAPVKLSSTVGCHPTRTSELVCGKISANDYMDRLSKLIENNPDHVAAIGEFGLDYDRLHFSDKETQLAGFERQFESLVFKYGKGHGSIKPLPLFLHCRAAESDFIHIMRKHRETFLNAVVHSFTGSWTECKDLLDLELHIGINGCSLKTAENLDVVRKIPLNKIMLETDCPYCEIRPSHDSHQFLASSQDKSLKPKLCNAEKWQPNCLVRGRNEPCRIADVFEVVAKLRCDQDGISEADLADKIYKNTLNVFENLPQE